MLTKNVIVSVPHITTDVIVILVWSGDLKRKIIIKPPLYVVSRAVKR